VKNVKINGIVYKINASTDLVMLDNRRCFGDISYSDAIIRIDTDFNIQVQHETLLHEILHGIIEDRQYEVDDEEKLCETFSKSLYQIIRDNKKLMLELMQ